MGVVSLFVERLLRQLIGTSCVHRDGHDQVPCAGARIELRQADLRGDRCEQLGEPKTFGLVDIELEYRFRHALRLTAGGRDARSRPAGGGAPWGTTAGWER